jgi:hypothetical protein
MAALSPIVQGVNREPGQLGDLSSGQIVLAKRNPRIDALNEFWAVAVGGRTGRAAGTSSAPAVMNAGEVPANAATSHRFY